MSFLSIAMCSFLDSLMLKFIMHIVILKPYKILKTNGCNLHVHVMCSSKYCTIWSICLRISCYSINGTLFIMVYNILESNILFFYSPSLQEVLCIESCVFHITHSYII
jgi:hypothetical protein